jgi:hypothetical protein
LNEPITPTFAEEVISFNKALDFTGILPAGISIMNPFRDNRGIMPVVEEFYNKYYNDHNQRNIILGINPGRFGAGVTGIPFTDTKRLSEKCGISFPGKETHELSSVFIYEMIDRFGGAEKFYSRFFINSVCPLGFTATGKNGKEINYNYYDSRELTEAAREFIVTSISKQIDFGVKRELCFCMGAGRNFRFLSGLNEEHRFFERIIPLEHPRYIMQYRSKNREHYINDYLEKLRLL